MPITSEKGRKRLWYLLAFFFFSFFLSFMVGRYPIEPLTLVKILLSKVFPIAVDWPAEMETVVFLIRLPRVIAAVLVGGALSVAGSVYQGLFQNPMVSPDVLGASAGAGFGAALGIMIGLGYTGISVFSFALGLAAVLLAYLASTRTRGNPTMGMVLAGIMIGSLFNSGTSLLKLVADTEEQLPAITYWLMGSLASVRMRDLAFAAPPILLGTLALFLMRWKINVLTLGEEEAQTMGVNTKVYRLVVVVCATLVTAASVSISGMIGWVGLVIPHIARKIVGFDYSVLLPGSMLLGGSFLLLVDNLARVMATSEVPIGILTSFVGAPFFLWLVLRKKEGA